MGETATCSIIGMVSAKVAALTNVTKRALNTATSASENTMRTTSIE